MARVTIVTKARKAGLVCSVCKLPIDIGQPYKWTHPRYKGKIVAHPDCAIPITMTSSSKMVAIWEAVEQIDTTVSLEDLMADLNSLAETVRDVGEEYQQSADNQREYFPYAELADENEERANNLSEWAGRLETAAQVVEEKQNAIAAREDEKQALEDEKQDLEDELAQLENLETPTEGQSARIDELTEEIEQREEDINQAEEDISQAEEEARMEADDAIAEQPE